MDAIDAMGTSMLGWIFKKMGRRPVAAPAAATTSPPLPAPVTAPEVDWAAALAQARGDDDALLALARTAGTPLRIKQAAVEALDGEAALKLAEREFRGHDRRAHQLAKQRLLAKVTQRRSREQAGRLLEAARGLAGMAQVPVNRVVELDRAWQSLEAGAIEAKQRDEFIALTAQLAARLRQDAEMELQRKRWHADAAAALRQLRAACTEAAAGTQDRARLAESTGAARGVAGALPPGEAAAPATVDALADLQQAIRIATALDGQLAVLDRLLAESAAAPTRAAEDPAVDPDAGEQPKAEAAGEPDNATDATDPQREWRALEPLPDPHLAALLQARHARWQQACDQARQARQSRHSQQREQAREQARERQLARTGEQLTALADAVAQAETAIEAGQLADAVRHLSDIDLQLKAGDAPTALRTRIAAARARLQQLRGWQHWAGGRARDELVLQAEALAAATVGGNGKGGGEVESEGDGEVDGDGAGAVVGESDNAVVAEVARLSIRQRADVIETLRKRWKELDGLGGSADHALWRRFDAALTRAGEPVAAHVAAQRAAREANLSARHQLLEALEAVADGAAGRPAEPPEMALIAVAEVAPPEANNEAPVEPPVDARGLALSLDRFHAEWRKLGPLEHTVPRAARAGLVERLATAVGRLEVPLQAARARAAAQRQALVARARSLAGGGSGRARDLVGEVRALQAEWQQHAKALPLARADEQALWADFKSAIDAAFAAREAEHSAREAEFEAHAAERSALIERLRPRAEDSPATQRRTLAEVEAAWQRCGPAPRARAAALDAEFRAARDVLRRCLDDDAQRAWQATCDGLDAKLALCLEREQQAAAGADLDAAAAAASWLALPPLPAPLEDALRRRAGLLPADRSDNSPNVDELLLQIECAWDLPTPPAFESARRQHKLRSMKESLEGRRSVAAEALEPVAAMALVLGRDGLNAEQRDRLARVLAAWRLRGSQGLQRLS